MLVTDFDAVQIRLVQIYDKYLIKWVILLSRANSHGCLLLTSWSSQGRRNHSNGPIFSEKYWYYFQRRKNVLCSIPSFVFWIFPPSDTAVQLESTYSKKNAISKSLFQDSFWRIFFGNEKYIILSEEKRTLIMIAPKIFRPSAISPLPDPLLSFMKDLLCKRF